MFSRMAWTPEVAISFGHIALMLASTTVWEVARPTAERKGLLPIVTTHDDRLPISLSIAAYINLAWAGLTSEETSVWGGLTVSMVVLIIMMWHG